ncbi:hypothetical protein ACXR0O_08555 [Verrucomicrobiota bacterium sgz303538]
MLSLFLGTHSRLVGLGGIDRSVRLLSEALEGKDTKKLQKLRCTCGTAATECRYWGEVARRIPSHDVSNRRAQYELALSTFPNVFGEDAWPVDSSKHIEPLDDLCKINGLDLKVVHLIKDVRSLTASFIDQARRHKGNTRPGALLAIEYFLRWRRENGKIDACLTRNHLPVQRVGYEEVCMAPEVIMGAVSGFLGLPAEPGSLTFDQSNSHLIVGNRMREQEEKQTLRYDHRWFARRDWIPAAVLLPQILRYNTRAVYSNGSDAMWTK